jgi:Uma2 family endonuclease
MNAAAALDYPADPSDGHDLSWLPPGPHTIDVLDILPVDHKYELVDGVLSIMDAPSNRHQDVSFNLAVALKSLLATDEWKPLFAPGFSRNAFNYRVPDLAVCRAEAASRNMKRAYLRPSECCLLCEVVSETTVLADRVSKPIEYANTGVPYYLRIELNDSGRVVKLFLCENIENPHRDVESDPERVYKQIAHTMTGGAPLPLPKPFTGPLDPNGL